MQSAIFILALRKISVRNFATVAQKLNKILVSKTLINYFNIEQKEATNIADKHKLLIRVKDDVLTKNCMTCKTYNIANKMIISYPEILAQQHLAKKIELLNLLPYPLTTTCPLLLITDISLKKFMARYETEAKIYPGGRIKFIAALTQLSEEEVCIKLVKIKFLQFGDLDRLKKAYNLILSIGLSRDDINKDLWALNYSLETLNERLVAASQKKVGKVKLWMIRAKHEIFYKYVERINNNREVLGNQSLIQYLSEKLDCTDEQAKFLLTKLPALENKSMKKMQEMLDFLYTKGFKPIHVYRVPKILLHSVNTVAKRLKEIEMKNIKLDSLYMLTKSEKQYQLYYESLNKSKKK